MFKVCGSIRRKLSEVNDIDIVTIPKPDSDYEFGEPTLDASIKIISKNQIISIGQKIKRFWYKNITVDLYIANESTFETLCLIRTGSKEHNVRLTTLAIGKQMKLKANGTGLCKIKGGIYNNEPEEIIEIVDRTENGILEKLLGRIPKPEDRN